MNIFLVRSPLDRPSVKVYYENIIRTPDNANSAGKLEPADDPFLLTGNQKPKTENGP